MTRGSAVIQNKSRPFATTVRASDKAKSCTTDWFYRRLDNGEKVLRPLMILACSRVSLLFRQFAAP